MLVLREAVGSVAQQSRELGSDGQVLGPETQNLTVPSFVLEKDHPRNSPESNLIKADDSDLKKAKEVGLASQGTR